jgi:dihydrofolate reductase
VRQVIVNEWMSLDGVVQAPMLTDEDIDGGFGQGGWQTRYFDDMADDWVMEYLEGAGGFLLGRRTYEIMAGYWQNVPEEQQVLAQHLNTRPKYVASTTLTEPLEWQNSTVLQGDVPIAVAALKQQGGEDVHVIGSARLTQTLIEHELVDVFRLMIDPVLVGGGKRLFTDDGVLRTLRLVDHRVTTKGAILATYAST